MKGITIATVIGFVASSITIILVPLVLISSSSRSPLFWNRIIWTEILVALVWAYMGGFFSLVIPKNRSIRGLGAIMPALGVIIVFYAISSFIIMIAAAYYPQLSSLNTASQIYKTAGLVIVIVLFFFSWVTGIADTEPIPDGVYTPNDLVISLQRQENSLTSSQELPLPDIKNKIDLLALGLKSLRERVQYSIPHIGKIGMDKGYILFANTVINLCEECSHLNLQLIDNDKLQSLILKATSLNSDVDSIAQALRR